MRSTLTVLLALSASGILIPTMVFAEGASAISEIIVTAERREANLQTVPVSVSALSAETLENRQISDSQDLQRYVPSLKMTNNITSPTNLSLSMRGSLQQDASLIVAESPVGIYVDDVYVARLNGNNISLNDIDRVEVLRGPQGTLYGRNTLAGAMKFVSRMPGEDSWLNASAGIGTYNTYLGKVSAGGPLGDGVSGSIAGQYNTKDGIFSNAITGEDTDYQRNYAVRGKLRYSGIENFDVVGSLSYANSKNDSLQLITATTPNVDDLHQFTSDDLKPVFGYYTVGTPPNASPAPPPITSPPSGETKQTIASVNMSYDFGALTLRSITGYVDTRDFFSTDFSGAGAIIGASDINDHTFSEELNVQGSALHDRLNYLAGVYYFNERGDQDFGWDFLVPTSTSQSTADTDSYAVFGQLDFKITSALKATVGLRWTRDKKTFSIDQQITPLVQSLNGPPLFLATLLVCNDPTEPSQPAFPAPANPTACSVSGLLNHVSLDNTYTETTPKFGLDYTFESFGPVDDLMAFVSAGRGFKSGGYNGIVIFNLLDAQNAYGPESNWTYEGGIKSEAFDHRVRMNLSYFWADIKDLTANATVGFSFPVTNVGDAAIHGFELDMTVVPVENLSVFWNATFQHGAYGTLDPGSAPAQAPAKWGVHPRVPQVPNFAYTVGFDYAVPIPGADMKFRIGADWFRTDDYVTSATNDFVASAYDRLNGFLGLDFGANWSARFGMTNIRDEKDITSGSRSTSASVGGPAGLGGFIILPPREFLFSVNYRK